MSQEINTDVEQTVEEVVVTEEVITLQDVEETNVQDNVVAEEEAPVQEDEETLGYPDVAAIMARIAEITPVNDDNFVIALGINEAAINSITNAEGYVNAKDALENIDIAVAAIALLLRNDSVLSSSIIASTARDFDATNSLFGVPASVTIMQALKSLDEGALSLVIALSMNAEYAETVMLRQMSSVFKARAIAEALGASDDESTEEEVATAAESTEGTQQA